MSQKIQKYVHTEETGIIPVEYLLQPDQIKKNAKLFAMIEVERNDVMDAEISNKEKKMLDINLVCFHINIPVTGYFDENLLRETLKRLPKEN